MNKHELERMQKCQRQLILCKNHLSNMEIKALYMDKEARKNALEACHHASEALSEVMKLLQPDR